MDNLDQEQVRTIQLTKGKSVLVDEDDYIKFSPYKWYCMQGKYATRDLWRGKEKKKTIRMHRLIMNCPENMQVDHINGNTLDNRKENLRIVTHKENCRNFHTANYKNKTSKYVGVRHEKEKRLWGAHIMVDGKSNFLGYYDSEAEAALAYNKAAKLFGFYFNNPIEEPIPAGGRKIDKRGRTLFLYRE